MGQFRAPTADEILQKREELRDQGTEVTAEELCVNATDDVRNEVFARLARIEAAERAFDPAPGFPAHRSADAFKPLGCVGRYSSPRVQAEGGMGVLCVAEDVELRRPVAYKVMKPGAGRDDAARERFFHEAEVTSRLNHPGVVPVYGRVTDGSGMPAYASAFVSGRTLAWRIDEYRSIRVEDRAARSLALAGLIDALIATCEVVAHAHSNRVVHGDIKPLNVLTDDSGATRLVDWGVARVIAAGDAQDLADGTDDLRSGTLPFISSPNRPATFVSDVYALGLTLALIVGEPGANLSSGLRRARDCPPALWAVAEKAMHVDRAARYRSAADLAADVRAVQVDQPISAYADPLWTRLRRWASRHRPTAVAAVVLVLVAGPFLAARESVLRRRADVERDRAVDLTKEMLNQADTVGKFQATLPGSKALLSRAIRLIEQLARDSEAAGNEIGSAARSYYRAGRIYQNLGQLDGAEECFGKAADLAEHWSSTDAANPDIRNLWASALRDWGVVRVMLGGDREVNEAWCRAVEMLSPYAARSADCRFTLARLHYAIGNQKMLGGDQNGAQASFEAARGLAAKLREESPGEPRHIKILADVFYNIGLSRYYQSNSKGDRRANSASLKRAEETHLEALRLRRRLKALEPGNPEHLADIAASLNELANVSQTRGRPYFAAATEYYRESRSLLEALVVAFPGVLAQRQKLAQVYSNLNVLQSAQDRRDEARIAARAAVDVLEKVLNDYPNSPDVLTDLGVARTQEARTLRQVGDSPGSLEADYQAAKSFARAMLITKEPNRREALAKKSTTLLKDLVVRGFFRDTSHSTDLTAEPAFSALRKRGDFVQP